GGIFYEHTHRLWASGVGLLTTVLAVWLWLKESRQWLRWLGVVAWLAVVLQGVLGGLRVTEKIPQLGIFHATLAQVFLTVIVLVALFTSHWWLNMFGLRQAAEPSEKARRMFVCVTLMILLQLALGATMRHQHAGLAVPDFPLAYGKIYPPTDAAFLDSINRARTDTRDFNAITAFHIHLHMAHRVMAALIFAGILGCAMTLRKQIGGAHIFARLAWAWFGLVCAQALLGAGTVWSNKAADIATLHVMTGAASLAFGSVLTVCLYRLTVDRINAHVLVQLGQDEETIAKLEHTVKVSRAEHPKK
ncbi:MAG: COX15/CtaA family protein, partial [Verrucomicrobia bacterium]|nr:COX15/CtaA family protein [Verrucomicrobiota bacterium]